MSLMGPNLLLRKYFALLRGLKCSEVISCHEKCGCSDLCEALLIDSSSCGSWTAMLKRQENEIFWGTLTSLKHTMTWIATAHSCLNGCVDVNQRSTGMAHYVNHRPENMQEMIITFNTKGDYWISEKRWYYILQLLYQFALSLKFTQQ